MDEKGVASLKDKFEKIDHVDTVLWYNSLADLSIPMEALPEKFYNAFNNEDTTMWQCSSIPRPQPMRHYRPLPISGIQPARAVSFQACLLWLRILRIYGKEEPIYVCIAALYLPALP